jgi:hypothetical protein
MKINLNSALFFNLSIFITSYLILVLFKLSFRFNYQLVDELLNLSIQPSPVLITTLTFSFIFFFFFYLNNINSYVRKFFYFDKNQKNNLDEFFVETNIDTL